MKPMNVYKIAADLVERHLAEADPAQPWPEALVLLACAIALPGPRADRIATIAALAIGTLSPEARARVVEGHDLPAPVRGRLGQSLAWPDPVSTEPAEADLEAVKLRALARLNQLAEDQAHRVVWGGDRLAQSYRKKEAQARLVADHPAPDDLPVEAIRYIHGEAEAMGATRAEVAASVLAKAAAWETWDALAVEPARQVAQARIAAADTAAEVVAAIDAAAAVITAGMDQIVAAEAAG